MGSSGMMFSALCLAGLCAGARSDARPRRQTQVPGAPRLTAIRPAAGKNFEVDQSGTLMLMQRTDYNLLLEGDITEDDTVYFTQSTSICDNTKFPLAGFKLDFSENRRPSLPGGKGATAAFRVKLDHQKLHGSDVPVYVCLNGVHQGGGLWNDTSLTTIRTVVDETASEIPIAVRFLIIVILLCLSGVFSGLNLGLMGLDMSELEVYASSGTPDQQIYAKRIMPFRKRGNFLLCTILIGNVLVNSVAVILLDAEFSGVVAIVLSTAAIVVFGEITPQSVCARHGLMIGAKTIPLVLFFMIITSPVSFPISLLLDYLLGDEVGQVFQKRQLLELVKQAGADAANDLEDEEMNIVAGALTYAEKAVYEVMTPLSDTFSLPRDAVLDFETMTRIIESGHSRIPVTVQNGMSFEIQAVVFVKDMAFVDPDEAMPLSQIIDFYNHEVLEVFHDIKLDEMLKRFKEKRTHLASVLKVKGNSKGGDPEYELIGIVTLEDVIEEIIGSEIQDETDRITDNQTRQPLLPNFKTPKESVFEIPSLHGQHKNVTDHVLMAAFTFLSDRVDSFKDERISKTVLKEMLTAHDSSCLVVVDKGADLEERQIYELGKPSAEYTLVLEGKLRISVGQEDFSFDADPWYPMCEEALAKDDYKTDFAAVADPKVRTVLFRVSRSQYRDGLTKTRAERRSQSTGSAQHPVSSPMMDKKIMTRSQEVRASSPAPAASPLADRKLWQGSQNALHKLPSSPTRPEVFPNRLNGQATTGAALLMARKESKDAKRAGSETPTFDSKRDRARSTSLSDSKPDTATSDGPPRSTLSTSSNASNVALPLVESAGSVTSAAAGSTASAQEGASPESAGADAGVQTPSDIIVTTSGMAPPQGPHSNVSDI